MNLAEISPRFRPTPTRIAFIGSLALSLMAWATSTINRDGMLYVDTARIFLEQGFLAAKANFSWPFISILIAAFSKLTGLPLEAAGYLMNALFMAGATAFLVAAACRNSPQAAWAICLVALAMPGINEYRNELLREFGCWFFIMAAFWLAQRWAEQPRWTSGLLAQGLIGLATLFRPEAAAMVPALLAWQLFAAPHGERRRRLLMIGGGAVAGLLALLLLHFSGWLGSERLAAEVSRVNIARFNAKAEAISTTFIEYARGQARTILFFGSLALIPVKLLNKLGLLLLPLLALLFVPNRPSLRDALRQHSLHAWGFAAQIVVLAVFVLDLQFLAGRYVGLLLLFTTPFFGLAIWQLMQCFPRWRDAITAALLLIMLASTFSLSGGKPQFLEAGQWLTHNASPSARTFVGSGRSAYYAGWGYKEAQASPTTLTEAVREGRYDLYIVEVRRDDNTVRDWIQRSGLVVVRRFANRHSDEVVVLSPNAGKLKKEAPSAK